MSDKRIIFFDIDGTLLNDHKVLPKSAAQAIYALKERGHEVAIATGRAPFMFEDLRQQLEIDTYVSYSGQYVVLRGEVIYTNPLHRESLHALTQLALLHNHAVVYMDDVNMRTNLPNDEFVAKTTYTLKNQVVPAHDPLYYQDRDIYQSLLICQYRDVIHDP